MITGMDSSIPNIVVIHTGKEFQLDGGVDGDDLHSPETNSPGRNLSAGEIFLSRCFLPRRGGGIFLWSLPEY